MLRRGRLCHSKSSVLLSVRPFVYLSVTFRYYDFHTRWNTSKIISRLISLRFLLGLTPTWAIWSNGNTPKIRRNRVGREAQKPAISLKRCKIGPRLLRQIGSRTRAFDWYQNQWPWMNLNGWNVTLAEIIKIYRAHHKNVNEDRPILSAAKYEPIILVSRYIRYRPICGYSRGFLGRGVEYNKCYTSVQTLNKNLFITYRGMSWLWDCE